jgi:hypothetical protein
MAAYTYQPNQTVTHVGTGAADTLTIPAASALANGKNFVRGFTPGTDTITITGFNAAVHGPVVANYPFLLLSPAGIPILFFEDFLTNAQITAMVSTQA